RRVRRQKSPSLRCRYHRHSLSSQASSAPICDTSVSSWPWIVSVNQIRQRARRARNEISQAGSSQHKPRLRVTNVIAHGPGIKLLYGLAEASTTGDTTYAYRCRVRFLRPHPGQHWTRSQQWKVPHCYCLAAGQLGYSSARRGMKMRSYFVKRLLLMIPTLLGISLVSFLIIHLTPGDPALLKLGDTEQRSGNQLLAAQIIDETRALYGLDQPLHVQYLRWLRRLVMFDFGESLRDHRPIIDKLRERIPVSVKLSGISLLFAYLISIPVGIRSATHFHSIGDRITTVVLFGLYSLPNFWIATMAIVYLGGGDFWRVFPVYGLASPNA